MLGGAFLTGSAILTAVGTTTTAPAIIVPAGAAVGVLYIALTYAWWRHLPPATQARLNPRERWPNPRPRRRVLALAATAWLLTLWASFTFLPDTTDPAIGAINVAVLWHTVAYLYTPTPDLTAAYTTTDGHFDWFTYLFATEPTNNDTPHPFLNPDGTIRPQDIPLDQLQAAWNAEQADIAAYKAAHA